MVALWTKGSLLVGLDELSNSFMVALFKNDKNIWLVITSFIQTTEKKIIVSRREVPKCLCTDLKSTVLNGDTYSSVKTNFILNSYLHPQGPGQCNMTSTATH